MIDQAQRNEWISIGLIQGPHESEEKFLFRVNESLALKEKRGISRIEPLEIPEYNLIFDWVPIRYSNKGLAPWHGGVLWIEGDPPLPMIQLRKAFKKQDSIFFGLISKNEILRHELAHVGRIGFENSKYEEFFAYHLSESKFRRWIGPIVQNPWEVWLFLAAILADLLLVLLFQSIWIGKLLILCVIVAGLRRLQYRHQTLQRKLNTIKDPNPWAILYRMSDQEIES
jgi:hypothetical protein